MSDLVTRLKLDNSEFNQNIESAKSKTQDFQKTADSTAKTLNELGDKGSKSARELLTEMNNLNNSGRGTTNYRKQLKEIQNTLNDLTISYRQMSDEMKASPVGQQVAGKIQELTAQAAQYKDAIQDVQQEIQRMSSDTAVWDGMKMGIQTVSASLQAFVAAGVLGEEQTEKLVAVIAKLKAIEAITNVVIRIGNALQKDQAVIAGISAIQHKALTAAKNAEAAATGKATIAQRLFNTVAKANPYVLLATALIAVVTALATFVKLTNKATEETKENTEATKRAKDAADAYKNTMANTYANLMVKYDELRRSWSKLSSEQERKEWIQNNKKAIQDLGIAVNNVKDAEDAFERNTAKVVDGFKKRAEAAALSARMVELYRQKMDLELNAKDLYNSIKVKAYDVVGNKVQGGFKRDATGDTFNEGRYGLNNQGQYYFTAKGAKEYNEQLFVSNKQLKGMNDEYKEINKQIDEASNKMSQLAGIIGDITSGVGGKEDEIIPAVGSLKHAQNEASKLQTQLENMNPNDANFEKVKTKLAEWNVIIDQIKKKLEITTKTAEEIELETLKEQLQMADDEVEALNKQLDEMSLFDPDYSNVLNQLNNWLKIQTNLYNIINKTNKAAAVKSAPTTEDKFNELHKQARDIDFNLSIGSIDKTSAQKQIDILNEELSKMGLTVRFAVGIDGKSVDQLKVDMNALAADLVQSTSSVVGSFNSVYESVKSLNETIDEAKNGWEAFFKCFETGMTILEAITNVIQTMATVSQLLTTVTEANTAAKAKNVAATTGEAAAATSDATAQAADSGATMTNAAAHGAAAAAKAGESAAAIPIAGAVLAPIAIVAVLAAVIAAIGALSAFADGGVVGGHSYYGDKVLARVNSGELILNQKQQEKLWGMMGGISNNVVAGNVEFKIKGSDLYGALSNYTKKMDKV